MPHGDNLLVLRNANRYVRSLGIPDGILGPKVLRLIEDGFILRILAGDPLTTSFRKDRIKRLLNRTDLEGTIHARNVPDSE